MCSAHSALVYNYLYRFLGDADEAADALVETFRRAYRGLDSFRGECSDRAWLMSIAVNVAKKGRASQGKNSHISLEDLRERGLGGDPEAAQDVERIVLNEVEARRLLHLLPEQQRCAVWMRVALQLTDDEVAQALGVPVGTVKSWVWRSMARLRKASREEVAE